MPKAGLFAKVGDAIEMDLTQFAWLRKNGLTENRDAVRIMFS